MSGPEITWTTILDDLEEEVNATERLCDDPARYRVGAACAWRAPADPGPIPASLGERAVQILERQFAAVARLRSAMATISSQRGRAHMRQSTTNAAHPEVPPVYIDTRA